MTSSPSRTINISPILTIENYDDTYNCMYKDFKIEYSQIKLSESRAHSIYENFNKIKYEICKFWFYNHSKNEKNNNSKIEMTLELIDYLKEKDFFCMNEIDKVLLTILYVELLKLRKYYKD